MSLPSSTHSVYALPVARERSMGAGGKGPVPPRLASTSSSSSSYSKHRGVVEVGKGFGGCALLCW